MLRAHAAPMTETTTLTADPRPAFAECATVVRAAAAQVATRHAQLPTPAGMSVEELLSHIILAVRRFAASGRGEPIDRWPTDAPDAALTGAPAALDAALDEAAAAWRDDATLTMHRALPWDPSPLGAETLAVAVNELLVHTWDLARAIGATATWSDDTVAAATAVMRKQLPIADRTPIWKALAAQFGGPDGVMDPPFADAVDVPEDASPIDRLVAWNGRDPS